MRNRRDGPTTAENPSDGSSAAWIGETKLGRALEWLMRFERSFDALVGAGIGLLGGLGAVGFRALVDGCQRLFFGESAGLIALGMGTPWYQRIAIPVIGGAIVGPLVYFFAREAKGHGVPEVMEAVALRGGRIRKRVVAIKALASAICMGSGGSVGREGPIVQIGSAIASTVGQFLRVSQDRLRLLVACGAAAGIAATFNAPLAGAMFSVELILGDFALRTFSPILISSVLATAVSREMLGDFPAFPVPPYALENPVELGFYLILGCLAALVALVFVTVLYRFEDLFELIPLPEPTKAALGGALVGAIALGYPHVFGIGYGTIEATLGNGMAWRLLLALLIFKILAVSITIGSGGSGGIFAPSLFLGAVLGGAFGTGVHALFPTITALPGAYALVAMGAVVAATTHGPVTAILILFELTGDYRIILPLMIACTTSALLATALRRESIYTLKLLRRGVEIHRGAEVHILSSLRVRDIVDRDVPRILSDMTFNRMLTFVGTSTHTTFPVVSRSGELVGTVSLEDLRALLSDHEGLPPDLILVHDLARHFPPTIIEDDNLATALESMAQQDVGALVVVDGADRRRVVGILTRRELLGAYNRVLLQRELV